MKITLIIATAFLISIINCFGYNLTPEQIKELSSNLIMTNRNILTFSNYIVCSTNTMRQYPFRCEPEYDSVTNIIIQPGYSGTIQVGTNFYRVSTLTNISFDYQLTK